MKFTDIAKRAKATKMVRIITDEAGEQWVNTGAATYKLEGLPRMDEDDFLRLAGVAEDKIDGFYKEREDITEAMLHSNDSGEIELTSDMAGIVVDFDGFQLMPFYTIHGVVWVDVGQMAPIIKGDTRYLRFFLRSYGYGKGCRIAVKDGLVMIALVDEYEMSEFLMKQIETLYKQCKERGITRRETEEGGNAMKYVICENCGAHLDHGEKCDCGGKK